MKAFLPWMMEKNHGYIVSIASVLSFQGLPKLSDYAASKAAALSFMESLRYELKMANKTGITLTTICPYHIRTELFKGKCYCSMTIDTYGTACSYTLALLFSTACS